MTLMVDLTLSRTRFSEHLTHALDNPRSRYVVGQSRADSTFSTKQSSEDCTNEALLMRSPEGLGVTCRRAIPEGVRRIVIGNTQ